MTKWIPTSVVISLSTLLIAVAGLAQTLKYPTQLDANDLKTPLFPHLKYLTPDLLSPDTKRALNREAEASLTGNPNAIEAPAITSVQRWSGAFAFDGPVQPFTMVGNFPQTTGKTFINVQLVPIRGVRRNHQSIDAYNCRDQAGPCSRPNARRPGFCQSQLYRWFRSVL